MSLQTRLDSLIVAIGADIKLARKLTSRLTAAVTNSTVTYTATGLSVTLVAGKTYRFRAFGQYQTAAITTGIDMRIGGTVTATRIRYSTFLFGVNNTTVTFRSGTSMNANLTPSSAVFAANTDYPWNIEGLIVVNSGGTLTIEFASEVAASLTTIQADSYLEVQEVA